MYVSRMYIQKGKTLLHNNNKLLKMKHTKNLKLESIVKLISFNYNH